SACSESCDYCGRSANEPIAAPADDVMEPIGAAFYEVYTDPVHVAAYESAEGGYLVPTTDTADAVEGLFGGFFSDDFQEAIAEAISGQTWIVCDSDPYGLSYSEVLKFGWDDFVRHVKHRSRYFFSVPEDEDREDRESISPSDFLARLSSMIEDLGLIRDSDAPWFRARIHPVEVSVDSGGTLGTPEEAPYSNRMSPAGICMFYGSFERDTALQEFLDPLKSSDGKRITTGLFRPSRSLRVLDLREIPPPPSYFDLERRDEYVVKTFLKGFVEDLAKPISKDGLEHIEYVPTQVVTEYFRRAYRDGDQRIDGILYPSSRREGGSCCVLFFEHEQCVDDRRRTSKGTLIEDWLVLECDTLMAEDLRRI
ncbi:MAG: HEPN-associated N-terminal domain-containing protein, partial [bacterium]